MNPYTKANQQRREVLPEQATPKKKERAKKAKGPSLSGSRAKKEL